MKNTNTVYALETNGDYGCAFETLETAEKMRDIMCKRLNIAIDSVSIIEVTTTTTIKKVS